MAENSTYGDGTDGFFGFVVGLYTAALVTPAVAIVVALGATTDPGVLFFTLLGTAVAVAGSVGLVARRESLAVRLGDSRWIWAAMGLPFLYFVGLFGLGVVRGEKPPSVVAGLAIVGALAGFIASIGFVAASHNRHTKAMTADAKELVRFTAPAPNRDRQVVEKVVIGLFAAGILGFIVGAAIGFDPLRWLFQMLVPMAAGLWGATTDRKIEVSDAGLVTGSPVHRRLRPWSAFESYDVTDEAIVIRRTGWSAWGLRDIRRDPNSVEDPEAVAAALGEFLPRRK
jgi:hypothetical protein